MALDVNARALAHRNFRANERVLGIFSVFVRLSGNMFYCLIIMFAKKNSKQTATTTQKQTHILIQNLVFLLKTFLSLIYNTKQALNCLQLLCC